MAGWLAVPATPLLVVLILLVLFQLLMMLTDEEQTTSSFFVHEKFNYNFVTCTCLYFFLCCGQTKERHITTHTTSTDATTSLFGFV